MKSTPNESSHLLILKGRPTWTAAIKRAIAILLVLSAVALVSLSDFSISFAQDISSMPIPDEEYRFVAKWGSKTDHALLYASKVAADPLGNLYVLTIDVREFMIQKYDSTGMPIAEFGTYGEGNGKIMSPAGLAADPSGDYIYVTDQAGKVLKFKSDGTFVKQWGSAGSGDGEFSQFVQGLAVDSDGNVFVADGGNSNIQKFSPDGMFVTKWGSDGSNDGEFSFPYAIAIGTDDGSIYVDDLGNRRIQKFTPEGKFVLKWSPGGDPVGIAVDSEGSVYVVPQSTGKVEKYTSNGQLISEFIGTSLEPVDLYPPIDVAVDGDGNIYTALQNSGAQKFDKNGKYISSFSVTREGIGGFRSPAGIAVDSDSGHVYVLDDVDLRVQKFTATGEYVSQWNLAFEPGAEAHDIVLDNEANVYIIWDGVKKFTPDGELISKWGPVGDGVGEINGPRAIAVDSEGDNVYAASSYRIQKFTMDGKYLSEWKTGDTGEESGQNVFVDDIAVDSEGRIYALEFSTNVVEIFTGEGKPLSKLDFSSDVPTVDGERANAFRIAIDENNGLYVCYVDGTIRKYDIDGNFIVQLASRGQRDGEVFYPTGIAFNERSDLVYVADGVTARVQAFGKQISSNQIGENQGSSVQQDLGWFWIVVAAAVAGTAGVVIKKYYSSRR